MNHTITALTPQQHNRQRINIFLDGEFAFGLSRIVSAWLQVGQTINDEKIAQLQAEDSRETAYQQALKFIGYRPRTQLEVSRNLRSHKIPEEVITGVVERMKRNGLLDDVHFARAWVENRSEMRPRSRRALAYELKQHGVEAQIIEETLENVEEAQLAEQAARKQMRRLAQLDWPGFRDKLYRYLAQRGFQYEIIAETAARLWAEQQERNLQGE